MPAKLTFPAPEDEDEAGRLGTGQAGRHPAEEALAAAEARIAALEQQLAATTATAQRYQTQLAALVENLPTGLLLVDPTGQVQLVNSYFRSLFNIAPDATIGNIYPLTAPGLVHINNAFANPAEFSARVQRLQQNGKTTLNQEFVLANGRVVELDYLVLEGGQAGRLVCYRDVTERHQREAQLRTLSYIPAQNPNSILRLSVAGEVIYANPAATPLLQVLAAEDQAEGGVLRTRLLDLVQQALRTNEQHQQELAVAGHHYLFTVVAVPDEAYATLYLTDVTARQQAEQQLREQRLFYESILNNVPTGISVMDADFRYVFVNPAVEPDPIIRAGLAGKTIAEAGRYRQRPPDVITQRHQGFELALREQREVAWEESFHDGQRQRANLMRLRPIIGPDGQVRQLVASVIDISARKQAEERQRESAALMQEQQAFIRLVVDALPNIVYMAGAENVVSFRNAAFDNMAALSQHVTGPKVALVEKQVQQIGAWRQQVLATGEPLNAELLLTMTNEDTCCLQVHMRPFRQADGRVEVLTVSTDITALKQAQQQAEENSRAKEAFLSRMSHEIRTPLNGVIGMAMLLEKTPLTPLQQDYLSAMQQAGQHLMSLVNDVLDLAKITTEHLELAQAPFEMSGALQAAGQTVAVLATQKGLHLTVEPLAVSGLRLVGDAYRLHQVLLNLLGNALKFTEQGFVQLGAQVVRESEADVTLRFWVQDTGVGIEPAQQEGVFEAFTQASAGRHHQAGGTGLGLAISEQLVHHMGGTLRMCSELNQGTTFSFTLTLPRAGDATLEAPADAVEGQYDALRGVRVLLAEDNAVNQWIATVVLEHWGVVVEAVDNGDAALVALTTNDYDAALLDIKMPGLNGVEVAEALRRHPDPVRSRLPIIALTANAFETDRASYLAAGMNACVNKPFEEAELCQPLVQLIKSRSGLQ
ncbi:PAS domain-containing protein [Hymenobacter sp.]|jgi:PAS domain S-box-containing protein|uniref:PAS domain-containing protein n=1 Tax=Hymenobacter sp. TaxID=1898978 RepID=UPI002ED8C71D